MVGFDKNLDKNLFSSAVEFDNSRITVAVFTYNGGMPKLQITRETKSKAGEYTFAKLGRMNKDEIKSILPLIEEAMPHL
ncbi:MAG: hypothetical protein WC471_05970 [Candidatus Woesearchaeota archaeon]|jgi:hypothetical protein